MSRFKSTLSPKKAIFNTSQNSPIASQHVQLRPTKLCLSIVVLSILVWVGAVNYQVNVAYAICFWLLGFIGVAALMTRRQLLGLLVQVRYDGEVFAGNEAIADVEFSSTSRRMRVFWWQNLADLSSEFELELDSDIQFEQHVHELNINDKKQKNHREQWQRVLFAHHANLNSNDPPKPKIAWHIPTEKRGYFPAHQLRFRLATSAPFGLFQAECWVEWQTPAVIFPAPLAHEEFGSQAAPDPEQTPQKAAYQGDDIAYLNNHQHGSSLQHVAWKVYAKRGELMDKVFDEPPPTAHKHLISYLDYPQGLNRDKLASLLAHRVLQADKMGLPYTLELPHTSLAPQNHQREKCLTALALM